MRPAGMVYIVGGLAALLSLTGMIEAQDHQEHSTAKGGVSVEVMETSVQCSGLVRQLKRG